MHELIHVFCHTFIDTLKIFPLLLLVYILIEWLEHHMDFSKHNHLLTGPWGPFVGTVAGCIPQCGFSAAASTLFNYKRMSGGALVAVFLATSDEAIPVLLAQPEHFPTVVKLLAVKIGIALFWGYIFWAVTWFRYRRFKPETPIITTEECHHKKTESFSFHHVLQHTVHISLYLLVTMLLINLITHWLGPDRISALLLADSFWQPVFAALIGLIPGCGTSILLITLFTQGTLSFGAVVAGLCSATGFGYLVLFQRRDVRSFLAIFCTFLAAAVSGLFLSLF